MNLADLERAAALRSSLKTAETDHTFAVWVAKQSFSSGKASIILGNDSRNQNLYLNEKEARTLLNSRVERLWSKVVSLRCRLREMGISLEEAA